MSIYAATRNWENLQIARFQDCVGQYEIPQMRPVTRVPDLSWVGFNYARGITDRDERKQHGLHFYLDDYQFQRLWTDPERYIPMLSDFGAVLSPDFSIYAEFPRAIQIYNVYRNMWLACLWQSMGMTVIPTIMWGVPSTFDFCFDGYPVGGIVAVSTQGSARTALTKQLFKAGFSEMMDRLQPSGIILHGRDLPEGCAGNIVARIETLTSQMARRIKEKQLQR